METFLDEQEFFVSPYLSPTVFYKSQDTAEEIKNMHSDTLAPSAGIMGKSFHPTADDILNPLLDDFKQRTQQNNTCASISASIICKYLPP